MRYASVCDGIGAAHVAWNNWDCAWTSEIEPFPAAVVEQRWGHRNLGDMLQLDERTIDEQQPVDLLVGGTPCQSFSVAGRRQGLDDPRGNLALRYVQLAEYMQPEWLVWENVPGVLSVNRGRDFGTFIGALADCGYALCWRVLDAQYFGVPQRRRRVFLVGHRRDWRRAAAVLLERESVQRHPPKSRSPGKVIACDPASITGTCSSKWHKGTGGPAGDEHYNLVAFTKAKRAQSSADDESWVPGVTAPTLNQFDVGDTRATTVVTSPPRRLTPRECERLQGFPDDYTAIEYRGKPAADSPRYKAIGNSMAVPVMRWIGERIEFVNRLEGGE